jgi:hypothetical protein
VYVLWISLFVDKFDPDFMKSFNLSKLSTPDLIFECRKKTLKKGLDSRVESGEPEITPDVRTSTFLGRKTLNVRRSGSPGQAVRGSREQQTSVCLGSSEGLKSEQLNAIA